MSLGYELVVFTSSFKFIKFILVSHPYKRSLDKRSLDCARDFASRLGRLLDGSSSSSSFRGHFIQQVVASGVRDKIKNTRCNVHDVQQPFCFKGLGHERCTFPHVHDVHNVHASRRVQQAALSKKQPRIARAKHSNW